MAYLVDTHLLLWTAQGVSSKVPPGVRARMDEEPCFISAVSGFEIATKHRQGRLPEAALLVEDFTGWVRKLGFALLSVTPEHAVRAGLFPAEHRDPFDRLLAAQALTEGVVLLSVDEKLDGFGARRVW